MQYPCPLYYVQKLTSPPPLPRPHPHPQHTPIHTHNISHPHPHKHLHPSPHKYMNPRVLTPLLCQGAASPCPCCSASPSLRCRISICSGLSLLLLLLLLLLASCSEAGTLAAPATTPCCCPPCSLGALPSVPPDRASRRRTSRSFPSCCSRSYALELSPEPLLNFHPSYTYRWKHLGHASVSLRR